MNEVDLIRICQQKGIDKGVAPKQYGITEMYSQGCLIREYAGFPCWLPLCVCADHGAGDPHVLKSEKDNDAYAMLAFSKAKKHFFHFSLLNKKIVLIQILKVQNSTYTVTLYYY